LNGVPTFLLGISYYGGLGAPEQFIQRDLDDLQRHGFNWLRVWATGGASDNNVSAVDAEGRPRQSFLGRLRGLVAECDRRGLVGDVTLTRGRGTPATAAGAQVKLSAAESSDPDGNRLNYRWWTYGEAGTYDGRVMIRGDEQAEAEVPVPADASGKTIHVILEVRDDGQPPLTSYRRAVLEVRQPLTG